MQEPRVRSLGWEDPLEKEMATPSSILACEIPWTEEPGGLPSTGSQEPRDFLKMAEAIFDEPEQSRKIVNICRERDFEVIIEDSCIGCGLCVNACTMKAIKLESLQAHADSIQCCGCTLCSDECPTNSIKILEIEYD